MKQKSYLLSAAGLKDTGLAAYRAYLPAITTLVGAVLVAVGLFFGQGQPTNAEFQWFRLIGAAIAALGAFWSAHRQVQSAARNKERDQKIIDLSEQLQNHLTGGDSFCYGYPMSVAPGLFEWLFAHTGKYSLSDVHVRISDLADLDTVGLLGRNHRLGTMFPGKALHSGVREAELPSHGYNLFFVARNGSWTQEIRWTNLPGVFAVANRVVRDGTRLDQPLLFEVSPEFPGRAPENEPWNDPPPYVAKSPEPSS